MLFRFGDVVMPAIAEVAKKNSVSFYWHLGDLRLGTDVDEDIKNAPQYRTRPMTVSQYLNGMWPDFIENQIKPFGSIPFMVGIGNHEVAIKTRDEFLIQFADWLNMPVLQQQRLKDDPTDHRMKTYYHWIQNGVDFIFLDNASNDQFLPAQMLWFNRTLQRAIANPAVTTIVAGMHKALPSGFNTHSMDESGTSIDTGRQVYAALLRAQNQGKKKVYVLASHQHNYSEEEAYDTEYWREHGGVLPGWIVGTAGAVRVPIVNPAMQHSITDVYGALLGTVLPGGEITFAFQRVNEWDTPDPVMTKYGRPFVHWCYTENKAAILQ